MPLACWHGKHQKNTIWRDFGTQNHSVEPGDAWAVGTPITPVATSGHSPRQPLDQPGPNLSLNAPRHRAQNRGLNPSTPQEGRPDLLARGVGREVLAQGERN